MLLGRWSRPSQHSFVSSLHPPVSTSWPLSPAVYACFSSTGTISGRFTGKLIESSKLDWSCVGHLILPVCAILLWIMDDPKVGDTQGETRCFASGRGEDVFSRPKLSEYRKLHFVCVCVCALCMFSDLQLLCELKSFTPDTSGTFQTQLWWLKAANSYPDQWRRKSLRS